MPAPLTNVAIANRALAKFGAGAITTMTDTTPPGPTVALVYETTILGLLSAYPWSFAKKPVALVRLADEQPDSAGFLMNGWRYAYQLPVDRLAPPDKYLRDPRFENAPVARFSVGDDRVYCDEEKLWAVGRFRPDESVWPAYFIAAAVACLAAELIMPVSGNASQAESLKAEAYGTPSENRRGGALGLAMHSDARNAGGQTLGVANLVYGWRS